jgi:hypothetical protein
VPRSLSRASLSRASLTSSAGPGAASADHGALVEAALAEDIDDQDLERLCAVLLDRRAAPTAHPRWPRLCVRVLERRLGAGLTGRAAGHLARVVEGQHGQAPVIELVRASALVPAIVACIESPPEPAERTITRLLELAVCLSSSAAVLPFLTSARLLSVTLPVMHKMVHQREIQVLVMMLMRDFCADRAGREAVTEERGLSLCMWAMKFHPMSAPVQSAGARALAAIAEDPGNRTTIGRERGLSALLVALRNHGESPEVVAAVCRALAAVTLDHPFNAAAFFSLFGPEEIGKVLVGPLRANPRAQMAALACACNVALAEEHCLALHNQGLPGITLDALATGIENAGVCSAALHLLTNLAAHIQHPTAWELVSSGRLLPLVEQVTVKHALDRDVQLEAVMCLLNLVARKDCAAAAAPAALPMILAILDRGASGDPVLAAHGMWALTNIVQSVPAASAFISGTAGDAEVAPPSLPSTAAPLAAQPAAPARGIGVILRVMHLHLSMKKTVLQGSKLARTLLAEDPRVHQQALEGGAVAIFIAVLEAHPDSAPAVEHASVCLALMTTSLEEARVKVSECGGIRVVRQVLKEHFQRPAVVEQAVWLLANLASLPSNRETLHTSGASEVVISLLRRHSFSAGVQVKAIQALGFLTMHGENQVRIARLGAIPAILSSMYLHLGHRLVQKNGCRVLSNLAIAAVNMPIIAECGGIEAILSAMSRQAKGAANGGALQKLMEIKRLDTGAVTLVEAAPANANAGASANATSSSAAISSSIASSTSRGSQLWRKLGSTIANFRIQEYGARCLSNMATNQDNALRIVSLGGVQRLCTALLFLKDFRAVQEYCLRALCSLAFFSAEAIVLTGASRVIIEAMKNPAHRRDLTIQDVSLRTLANLAVSQETTTLLQAAGCINATIKCGSAYLARTEEVAGGGSGGGEVIEGAERIVEQALKVLLNICIISPSGAEVAKAAGADALAEQAVRALATNKVIHRTGARLAAILTPGSPESENPRPQAVKAWHYVDLCPSEESSF